MSFALTHEQAAILAHEAGPLCVGALAGTGKTTTMLEFIKTLLARGTRTEDIVMLTFSRMGAADMRERAARAGLPSGIDFRTLHSLALRMVKAAGHRRTVVVAKDWQVARLAKSALKELTAAGHRELPKVGEVLREVGLAKAALVWPTPWTASDGTEFPGFLTWAEQQGMDPQLASIVDVCYRRIEAGCRAPEAHGFDKLTNAILVSFDDMLAVVARAVLRGARKDRWVEPFRGSFKWVIVDEVQDNSLPQWVMVRHLAGERMNIVAVGDDMQSIFKFRGAVPQLMREFAAEAKFLPLSRNWRSGQRILDAANLVLEGAEDRLVTGGLVAGRDLHATVSLSKHDGPAGEACSVVCDIAELIEGGQDPDEISVLYRLNACSGPFEVELIRRGIAYKIAGTSFFGRGPVKAAIGYLAAALDEDDEDGFRACYALPLRGLGRGFQRAHPTVRSTRDAKARRELGRWRRGATGLLRVVDTLQDKLAEFGLVESLRYLFDEVGLREHFREDGANADDETETDIACDALLDCAETLASAEELVEFARSMTGHEDRTGERTPTPRVTLSTVHKAKGLEWGAVFATGFEEGLFPFRRGDAEEERRLAYVALTRACHHLHLSHSGEASWIARTVGPWLAGDAAEVAA